MISLLAYLQYFLQHFLFRVEHSVPRVMITFSEEELYVLQKKCQAYMGRMNELARQHTMTRYSKYLTLLLVL